jgi:hypothetical protein
MHELITQRPEADWVDQDLLTRDLAGALLDKEIAAQRGALGRLAAGDGTRSRAQQRLDSMIALRQRVAVPRGDQHVGLHRHHDEKGC